jgi:hypothetical protein
VTDTTPNIGDTRPAPDDERAGVDVVKQLREAYDRSQRRNAELEHLPAENGALRRQLGLARAGVDPDSIFGQTVTAAAEASGLSDPADVADLARALRVELTNGGNGRREE